MKNRRKINNKGFSLIEVLVAVVMLAVVMTPLLRGFVSTAEVNKSAREYMGGTDVTQCVLEGITNKSYQQFSESISSLIGGSDLVGESSLSGIGNGAYNLASNVSVLSTGAFSLSDVKMDGQFKYGTNNYTKNDLLSSTGNIMRTMTEDFALEVANLWHEGQDVKLTIWEDADSNCVFLCYTGINVDNRKYVVSVGVVPCGNDIGDTYIPYVVYCSSWMYDKTKSGTSSHLIPVGNISSGIRAHR